MKHCPQCQTNYTDDTLQFCLQDGTPLVSQPNSPPPTNVFTDSETLVYPRQVERLDVPIADSARSWEPSQQTRVSVMPPPKKPKTALIVTLTALLTLLVFGGAIGMWFLLKHRNNEVAQNANNKITANRNIIPKDNTETPEITPSPTVTPSPTPTAAPSPTPPKFNPEQVKREVSEKINAWNSAIESNNLNAYMNYYADKIDYYNKKSVSSDYVRNDKQRAFNKYDNVEMNISNVRITPDASGEKATAVFDKQWTFESDEDYSAGKVQSQLQLQKFNGIWLITGEKDLKVYYTEK